MTKSKALLFGIDYLKSSQPLRGCATDVKNVATFLTKELKYDSVKVYTEQDTPDKVKGQNMIRALCKLASESHYLALERAWIHFSGHGVGVRDRDGDELDGQDECICPVDYGKVGVISDDIIKRILRMFNPATKITCVFDCCHSGTVGDLRYRLDERGEYTTENKESKCAGNVVLLSGCRDNQVSADAWNVNDDYMFSGALTSCLLACLYYRHKLSATVSGADILRDVRIMLKRKGFKQVPVITMSNKQVDFI